MIPNPRFLNEFRKADWFRLACFRFEKYSLFLSLNKMSRKTVYYTYYVLAIHHC